MAAAALTVFRNPLEFPPPPIWLPTPLGVERPRLPLAMREEAAAAAALGALERVGALLVTAL